MSSGEKNGFLLRWRIENFSFCYHEKEDCIASPSFIPENTNTKWSIDLYPRGDASETKRNTISLLLCREKAGDERIDAQSAKISIKLELISPSGKTLACCEEKKISVSVDGWLGKSDFIDIGVVMQDIELINRDTLTVCCHIYDINSHELNSETYEVCTKIQIYRQSFRWNVKRDERDSITDEYISLPNSVEFHIKLHKVENVFRLFIYRTKVKYFSTHFVKIQLKLLTANGSEEHSVKGAHLFKSRDIGDDSDFPWEFPLLLHSNFEDSNDEDASLMLQCKFSCSGESITCNNPLATQLLWRQNTKCESTINDFPTLQEDVYDMLRKKKYCDIKLRAADDSIIEAHKTILSSRSPVFSTMFDQEMLEAQTGVVSIPDVDVCTLNSFLKFLYTDTVDNLNHESSTNLIMIANKYQVLSLKEKCANFLKSNLSTVNACEVAELADMVCHNELKSLAVDFIAANSKTIFKMPEWIPWMKANMELATEIFSKLTENVTLS